MGDYLFHTFLLSFEHPAFYAGVRVYDFSAEVNIMNVSITIRVTCL